LYAVTAAATVITSCLHTLKICSAEDDVLEQDVTSRCMLTFKASAAADYASLNCCAPANCSKAAVGSLPGDSTKMSGVVALLSA
jgi:hypothetical protein